MNSQARGFSLIEVVVAMVLISGAGYAVFAWINTNISSLSRIHEINARSAVTQNILEYMSGVNPMLRPQGTASLGTYTLRWEAKPITLVQEGKGLYNLALYDTAIEAVRGDARPALKFNLRLVGYKQVRENLGP